ncbi:hypothetical protein [Planosporangium mesophilum]|uniref:Uncharacterized protein n=1 Tax=Planosporangium mesophilum TaxID=689768 RepID=A0A8J3TEL5_9ACTN|nr:hypothetical protein [Planosporangium mesophilum]GII25720.1 hypothetical protein Pme01_53170 [Planosporangium mesophilum]
MNYSIGIWAYAQVPRGVIYRWEAGGGDCGTGFVLLETAARAVRPCAEDGALLGDLVLDVDSGSLTGDAAGVSRAAFTKIAAAILKSILKSGQAPQTAHTYFG